MDDLLKIALSQYGISEITGPVDNPEVMKYFHETGRTWVDHDETPWCDAFLDWCAMKAGYKFSKGLNARGWLIEWVELFRPNLGDIVVFWRKSPDSVYGHAGLFIRKHGSSIWVLGGNQSDSVCIKPYSEKQLLGYRRLFK